MVIFILWFVCLGPWGVLPSLRVSISIHSKGTLQCSPLPPQRDVAAYGFLGLTGVGGAWRRTEEKHWSPTVAGLLFICLSGQALLLRAKAGCQGGCPGPGVNKDPRA